jgi:hypothetical protein
VISRVSRSPPLPSTHRSSKKNVPSLWWLMLQTSDFVTCGSVNSCFKLYFVEKVYILFGCIELGQESGIREFGPEFRCLEWHRNLAQNSARILWRTSRISSQAKRVSDPLGSEIGWKPANPILERGDANLRSPVATGNFPTNL